MSLMAFLTYFPATRWVWNRIASRLARKLWLTVGSAVFLVFAVIQIQQIIFRYRAEQLLADIQSISMRRTTFDQAGVILSRWSGSGQYAIPCARQHCDIQLSLSEPNRFYQSPILLHVYRLLGGHDAQVSAGVRVRNGFVWGERYVVVVGVSLINEDYGLIGLLETSWGPEHLNDHPEYRLGWPSACSSCIAVFARFTPYAEQSDIRRLGQFNLSCLTRWRPCRTKGDIMPAVMAEIKQRENNTIEVNERGCDLQGIRITGRDAENAAIVDVADVHGDSENLPYQPQIFQVRLVQRLKRASFWEVGTKRSVAVAEQLHTGDRIILLFSKNDQGIPVPDSFPGECGAVPYNKNTLSMVDIGISQDDRVDPLSEYSDVKYRKFSDPPGSPPPPVPSAN